MTLTMTAIAPPPARTQVGLIDCDIHNTPVPGALKHYLPQRWRESRVGQPAQQARRRIVTRRRPQLSPGHQPEELTRLRHRCPSRSAAAHQAKPPAADRAGPARSDLAGPARSGSCWRFS